MRLAIISDCVHVFTPQGNAGSDVHIFVRQMEALSIYFSEVHICCPFISYNNSVPITNYSSTKISFIPLQNVGGNGFAEKMKLIFQIPNWFKAYKKVNLISDIVYQRYPNNINIPGFFYFFFINKKVFATYTGTWGKNNNESITYTFQKWVLKHFFKGPVGVYTTSFNLPNHIFKSFSPSYNLVEWQEEIENVAKKIQSIKENGLPILSMITVGSFVAYKNQQYILNTCLLLREHNIPFHLYMVGDGELMHQYKLFITKNKLQDNITITGKLVFSDVRAIYQKTNFVVQAPLMEGFGKVPLEGYFHGTIPIVNNITMAGDITKNNTLGYLFDVNTSTSLFNVLISIYKNPHQILNRISEARVFVKQFTLENWALEYYNKLIKHYPNLVIKNN